MGTNQEFGLGHLLLFPLDESRQERLERTEPVVNRPE
jgi:hypothetical protein